MDKREYIYLAPPRGRLPWGSSIHRTRVKLRPIFWFFLAGAAFWGSLWWWLR